MTTTTLFTIDGKPMLLPDEGVGFSFEDLDSSDAGRDESGYMHRSIVRHKVGAWSFSYAFLTEQERSYLEGLFPESGTFTFGHPDRRDTGKTVTCTAYRSKYSLSWFHASKGIWKNYGFSIIEC